MGQGRKCAVGHRSVRARKMQAVHMQWNTLRVDDRCGGEQCMGSGPRELEMRRAGCVQWGSSDSKQPAQRLRSTRRRDVGGHAGGTV